MSGITEIEINSRAFKTNPAMNDANIINLKDDVFCGTQETGRINGLSRQLQLMQTSDKAAKSMTDLILKHSQSNFQPIRLNSRDEGVKDTRVGLCKKRINGCSQTEPEEEDREILNSNDSRVSMLDGVASFAHQTARSTLSDGLRESSMFGVFSNFKVPTIVINSVPDDAKHLDEANEEGRDKIDDWTEEKEAPWEADPNTNFNTKCVDKHRSRSYYRPYCIINRRHYTCRSYSYRHRKYGVSQKINMKSGVDELTQLLNKMKTGDESEIHKDHMLRKKWQYSPPPKYCTIRYRPCVVLAEIKERSRSLNDLSLQDLCLDGTATESGACDQYVEPGTSGTQMMRSTMSDNTATLQCGTSKTVDPCISNVRVDSSVEYVASSFTELNME